MTERDDKQQRMADTSSAEKALQENKDIASESQIVETEKTRVLVKDTDVGKKIMAYISDLEELMQEYRNGSIEPGTKLF